MSLDVYIKSKKKEEDREWVKHHPQHEQDGTKDIRIRK